ncbi:MAG: helicase RepA family protein [Actinomycetota bacterium]|nr:helicase RepA family protein [Actinomycetota bacterium]
MEKGGMVLYFDQENGLRIMAERAQNLGITPALAKNFYHYPFPTMPLDFAVIEAFEQLLDELEADLVVFDSWVSMLAMCGLDENSSVDIATWTEAYSQKARHKGVAVLILDHVPKEGGSARGSGRKLDYVDVMWELRNPQPFDRENRHLLAAALERIPAIEAPQEPRGEPETGRQDAGGVDRGEAVEAQAGAEEPPTNVERSTEEPARRPWWIRIFGG